MPDVPTGTGQVTNELVDEERRCPVCSGLLEDNERVHRRRAPALVSLFDDEADG